MLCQQEDWRGREAGEDQERQFEKFGVMVLENIDFRNDWLYAGQKVVGRYDNKHGMDCKKKKTRKHQNNSLKHQRKFPPLRQVFRPFDLPNT